MRKHLNTLVIIAVAMLALFVGVNKSDGIKNSFANFGDSWHNGEIAVANYLVGDQYVSTSDYQNVRLAYEQVMMDKGQLASNKDAEILVLKQNLEIKDKALGAQTQRVAEFEQKDRDRQNEIAEKEKAISDLNLVITQKDTEIRSAVMADATADNRPTWIEIAWNWTATKVDNAATVVARQF